MMTRDQMISEYTSIFNACQSVSELYDVVSGIDWGNLDGVTVAGITDAAEVAEKKLQAASAERAEAAAEFDRIFVAGRGTVRIERADYVIIAHCQSYTTIEVTRIKHTRWYVSAYANDKLRRRDEFDALLTFDQLSQWIDNVIAADQDR